MLAMERLCISEINYWILVQTVNCGSDERGSRKMQNFLSDRTCTVILRPAFGRRTSRTCLHFECSVAAFQRRLGGEATSARISPKHLRQVLPPNAGPTATDSAS